MDIHPEVGITEDEVVRIANRLYFGQTENDIIEFYRIKGQPSSYAKMVYAAAKTYMTINDREYITNQEGFCRPIIKR